MPPLYKCVGDMEPEEAKLFLHLCYHDTKPDVELASEEDLAKKHAEMARRFAPDYRGDE